MGCHIGLVNRTHIATRIARRWICQCWHLHVFHYTHFIWMKPIWAEKSSKKAIFLLIVIQILFQFFWLSFICIIFILTFFFVFFFIIFRLSLIFLFVWFVFVFLINAKIWFLFLGDCLPLLLHIHFNERLIRL